MIILHRDTREYIYPISRNRVVVRLQAQTRSLTECEIVFWNRFTPENIQWKMLNCVGRDGVLDYYIAELNFCESAKYLRYYFKLKSENSIVFFSRDGQTDAQPSTFFEYLATAESDIYSIPDWAKGIIWYQIFPDRFCNGQPANDPSNCVKWNSEPTRDNYFGGDLTGIQLKLPYLQELGVEAIYLTSIFASPSNHKYDTVDYYRIDPAFGTEKQLVEFVGKCHQSHIRIILDGVFNHCGYEFPPFQDVLKNGEASPYADWFYINSFPVKTDPPNYECVGYYKWMPKLRYGNPKVRAYFLEVGVYWIHIADIDGWRLDVADEVDFTFWQEFRRAIKSEKPDALLLAETWKDGNDLLRGDQMDSVMNYLFRDACVDFFAKGTIDSTTFNRRIQNILHCTPTPIQLVMYNLIGSHDTARFLTLCCGDIRKLKLATVFQMTFPGMPAIYYGDETGMSGENDPGCRRSMNWESADWNLQKFFKKLISLRKKSSAIRYGSFWALLCDKYIYGFARRSAYESAYIIINNSPEVQHIILPIFERIEEIESMECPVSDASYVPKVLNNAESLYNNDICNYSSQLEIVLSAYCFELIFIRRSEDEN